MKLVELFRLGRNVPHFRRLAGALLNDWPRYQRLLGQRGQGYLALCNRAERLEPAPDDSGFRCLWQWTSDLHAPKVIPALGRRLMSQALAEHPIGQSETSATLLEVAPQVSFIIGHRGMSRLPHLLATIHSIAAQQGATRECIVVEQDVVSQLGPHLPDWVKLVHTPPPTADIPYCRAWTFNVGIRYVRGDVLVLHDNDMLVPVDYAAQILNRVAQGYDVVNLKRFIFYLTQTHTQAFFAREAGLLDMAPELIVQNLEGGGSLAITRAGYDQIGGLDESFVGWGGEDNEFWERAQTLRVWPYGYLPLVHLWHPSQPMKQELDNPTLLRSRLLSVIPVGERISRLRTTRQGALSGPAGYSGERLTHVYGGHTASEERS